jgi:hypothetical protein
MQYAPGTLAAICALLLAASAAAQEPASDLDFRGIRSVKVTASPAPQAALDCNIDTQALVRDLERQFDGGGLRTAAGTENLATITVLSTYETSTGICSSALMLGAYTKVSFFADAAGWLRSGYAVVWQSGLIVTSTPEEHLETARQALARLGNSLLDTWHTQNAATQ